MNHIKTYTIMKKLFFLLLIAITFSNCGTIYGGRISQCQKTKPIPGTQTRQIRIGALIGDIVFFPYISLPVDFATGAIYKPCQSEKK